MKLRFLILLILLFPSVVYSEIGYKDLRIGMKYSDVEDICGKITIIDAKGRKDRKCPNYSGKPYPYVKLYFDPSCYLGCKANSTNKLKIFNVTIGKYDRKVYNKILSSLERKYSKDYHYSYKQELDFVIGETNLISVSFEKGTVVLTQWKYRSGERGVTIGYHNEEYGRDWVKKYGPPPVTQTPKINTDDF